MRIHDTITDANYMSRTGIIVSIAKMTNKQPAETYSRLAKKAARRTSQRLGAHIEHANNALYVFDDVIPESLVLSKFKDEYRRAVFADAGLA